MKTVRVYYAGIPIKNTNPEKRRVLESFHQGVPTGQSTEVEGKDWQPSDLAVIQGWVHANSKNTPHLMFRKQIIDRQRSIGKSVLAIDSNLFLYLDPGNTKSYLRFSLNDVFPTTGEYFTNNIDPMRWNKIQRDLNIEVKEWKTKGKHILICLQRNGGWSMGGLDVMKWLNSTILKLKKYTDRRIIVRAHPGDGRVKDYLRINHEGVRISTNPHITDDLKQAWATITYNSSPGVASAIEGVPVFVTDPEPRRSQAFDVANFDLTRIEKPQLFDREPWLHKIAMSHYNFDDLKSGAAWEVIKDYI